jgi:hypothetical protein
VVQPENFTSLPAAADYSAITKPRFAVPNGTGKMALCGAGAIAAGIMDNAPKADEPARIEWGGVQKVEAGTGGLALGAKVASSATGTGVTAGADTYFMGIVTLAAAEGAVAKFTWTPGYIKA